MRAFFLPVDPGNRFCIYHEPVGKIKGSLVCVPPLFEEMNFSRRQIALQARRFAESGFAVLQIDLYGCGDSDGHCADANWLHWVADIGAAWAYLLELHGRAPALWGIRGGSLLAVQMAKERQQAMDFLFWQPVLSGEIHWQQFLRVRRIADALGSSVETGSTPEAQDSFVEVLGYQCRPDLYTGLRSAVLDISQNAKRVACVEIGSGGTSQALKAWSSGFIETGSQVELHFVQGSPFWMVPESEDPVELAATSLQVLDRWVETPA